LFLFVVAILVMIFVGWEIWWFLWNWGEWVRGNFWDCWADFNVINALLVFMDFGSLGHCFLRLFANWCLCLGYRRCCDRFCYWKYLKLTSCFEVDLKVNYDEIFDYFPYINFFFCVEICVYFIFILIYTIVLIFKF
jgi:hypothetical protein